MLTIISTNLVNSSPTLGFGNIFNWSIGMNGCGGEVIKLNVAVMGISGAVCGETPTVFVESM